MGRIKLINLFINERIVIGRCEVLAAFYSLTDRRYQ